MNPSSESGPSTSRSPPGAAPQISKFTPDGYFWVNTNTVGNAAPRHSSRFKLDGKEYPAEGPDFDTVIWKQNGKRGYEHETRKGGKTVHTVSTEVSPDLKTRKYRYTRARDNSIFDGVQDRVGGDADRANPLLGEWRLRQTNEWKQQGDELLYAAGTLRYRARIDGKNYPVQGSTNYDTVSLRRVDGKGLETRYKKDGKAVNVFTITMAPGSKSFTSRAANRGDTVWERAKN